MTYEEKAKLAMKINKRMRDIVNKTGLTTAEFDYFENRITTGTLKTATAYTENDEAYQLLSRSKKDIESYSESDLLALEQRTRKWSQVKEEVERAMNSQALEEGGEPVKHSMSEIREFLNMRKALRDWFDENHDLVYQILENTGWENIGSHTNQEIYNEVMKARAQGLKSYSEEDQDKIRSEYRARRERLQARLALQK